MWTVIPSTASLVIEPASCVAIRIRRVERQEGRDVPERVPLIGYPFWDAYCAIRSSMPCGASGWKQIMRFL